MSKAQIDAHSWEFTQRIVRIWHNRLVRKHFKDVGSDDSTGSGRATLKSSVIIRDEDSALETLVKLVFFWLYLKGIDAISSMPFQWQMLPEFDRPQLAVIFRVQERKNKSGNYTLHIPHYNGNRQPEIPEYTKGNWWARVILKDNSKLTVYAQTKTEAERVIDKLTHYIDRKYLVEHSKPSFGYMEHKPFKEIKVKPHRADFYSQGKKDSSGKRNDISWRYYF